MTPMDRIGIPPNFNIPYQPSMDEGFGQDFDDDTELTEEQLAEQEDRARFDAEVEETKSTIIQEYWAAKPPDELAKAINDKETRYYDVARDYGFIRMWRVMKAQYYGQDPEALAAWETQQVGFDGENGELVRLRMNETRSFFKQTVTMALNQRPAFQCLTVNDDYDSVAQAKAGDNIVTYIYTSKYGERKEKKTVERAGLFGLGWSWVAWDPTAGKDQKLNTEDAVAEQAQQPFRQMGNQSVAGGIAQQQPQQAQAKPARGDLFIRSKAPWEVFYEPFVEDPDDHLWRCVRERRSKWELAAVFPQHAQRLLAMGPQDTAMQMLEGLEMEPRDSDRLVVKHWYHLPNPALPNGRYAIICGDIALKVVDLPYDDIPLLELCPAEYIGMAFGYADSWDLCSLNQILDQVVSDIATNLSTFGRQCIWMEDGTDYDEEAIANGARVLTGLPNSKPPQAVQLAAIPESAKWFLEYLEKRFQSISGLNGVVRGDPNHNITSGTMAALFHSIAIEYNSALQAAVDNHRERLANLILAILKRYAEHPVIAEIAGISERPYLKSFTSDKLAGISKVTVKTANPMMRSQAGRMELTQMLLKIPGAITSPEQVIEVLVTGQLKPVFDGPMAKRQRMKYENEMLQQIAAMSPEEYATVVTTKPVEPPPGSPPPPPGFKPLMYDCVETVPVSFLDDHALHIQEHESLLAPAGAMMNQQLRKAVMAHIQEHIKQWTNMDIEIARLTKQTVMPPPPPPPPGEIDMAQGGKPMPSHGGSKPIEGGGGGKPPNSMVNGPPPGKDKTGVPLPRSAASPVPNNSGAPA